MNFVNFLHLFFFGQNVLISPSPKYPSGENVLITSCCILLPSHIHYNITLKIFLFSFTFKFHTFESDPDQRGIQNPEDGAFCENI